MSALSPAAEARLDATLEAIGPCPPVVGGWTMESGAALPLDPTEREAVRAWRRARVEAGRDAVEAEADGAYLRHLRRLA